jgi:hypothetical protein
MSIRRTILYPGSLLVYPVDPKFTLLILPHSRIFSEGDGDILASRCFSDVDNFTARLISFGTYQLLYSSVTKSSSSYRLYITNKVDLGHGKVLSDTKFGRNVSSLAKLTAGASGFLFSPMQPFSFAYTAIYSSNHLDCFTPSSCLNLTRQRSRSEYVPRTAMGARQ